MSDQVTIPADPAVLAVGRVNFDLYVTEPRVPIQQGRHYLASVGGSPANIAIVARRLGIPTALLSATGPDFSARFVRAELERHGVDTRWIGHSLRGATSLALLATLEPDVGERNFYRDDPADVYVEPDVVDGLPWRTLRAVVLSADALARGPMADTVVRVAAEAKARQIEVWWDLDLRPDSWPTLDLYAERVSGAVDQAATVIGTESEFAAYLQASSDPVTDFAAEIGRRRLRTVVLKRGPKGAELYLDAVSACTTPARSALPVCTVGGGDATAGAMVAARVAGRSWVQAMELAMTVAGWTVNEPYCSTGFPSAEELGLDPLSVEEVADEGVAAGHPRVG